MGTKKLTTILRLLVPRLSLKSKMVLVLHVQKFYIALAQDLEDSATKAGQLHTLQALRAITEDKIENGRQ